MRYIVAAVIAALILSTASYAQNRKVYFYNPGDQSCGKYLAATYGHPPGAGMGINDRQGRQYSDDHHLYLTWLGGFFTAMNLYVMDNPNQIDSDKAAIDVWIRKWCEQNPTKLLHEAASAFVLDQRKEYLQGWYARQAR